MADAGPLAAAGVLSIVLARVIGPSGNGEYALLATLVSLAVLLFSLGLASGITYEVSGGRWSVRPAFRESYAAALVLGVLGFGAAIAFYVFTRHSVMRAFDPPVVVLALASIPPLLAAQFASAILLGADRYEGYAALLLTSAAFTLAVSSGWPCRSASPGRSPAWPRRASRPRWSARCCWAAAATRRPGAGAPASEGVPIRTPGLGGNLFQQVNYRFDVIILAAYASTTEVGVYSVALTPTGLAWVLPHALQTVIFPRAASLDAAAEAGEVSHEESDAAVPAPRVTASCCSCHPGVIVLILLGLVPLVYGREFDQTVGLGLVLLPGVLALGMGKVLASVITGGAGRATTSTRARSSLRSRSRCTLR